MIDFGIAKAVDADLLKSDVQTVEGQFIGTPHYMAPEQIGFTAQDVDVRRMSIPSGPSPANCSSAGWSIRTRFDGLGACGLSGLQKLLCEREAIQGSARLQEIMATDPELASSIASHRGMDPRSLRRLLLGDLDGSWRRPSSAIVIGDTQPRSALPRT